MNDFMNSPEYPELLESIRTVDRKLDKLLENQEDTTRRLKRFAVALAEAITRMKNMSSPPQMEASIYYRNRQNGQTTIVPVKVKPEKPHITIAEKKEYLQKKLRELEIQESLEEDELT